MKKTLIAYSNSLAFVWIMLKIGDNNPAIYCLKLFDIFNYITLRWVTYGFMWLATLQFETRLQKCIRMEITIFNFFILVGTCISSDMRSEIKYYGSAQVSP